MVRHPVDAICRDNNGTKHARRGFGEVQGSSHTDELGAPNPPR